MGSEVNASEGTKSTSEVWKITFNLDLLVFLFLLENDARFLNNY